MPHQITIHGAEGEIRWVYHTAATLGPWTASADGSEADLTATVRSADAFKLEQPDLTFRVVRQTGPAWVWPVRALHVEGETLTARLGPQE